MAEIVCAAFIDDGRVLLARRAAHRKWSANKWDLVGGHVEKGEGLDVALVRECQEEVGLTPRAFDHVATLYEDDDRKKKSPFHIFRVPLWDGGLRVCWDTSIRSLAGLGLRAFSRPSSRLTPIATRYRRCCRPTN
ncbi:NUDIX domain-containing protein [Rhizobium wenxiniae]|uniref:NUDIX domain-containing protein n=1 Tax=Rhizobium wenxiniae TaxID=1737357 RepID=UPI001C6F569D|nr:NUDIX domain-containing protein [Rhizobium wenxiniae]